MVDKLLKHTSDEQHQRPDGDEAGRDGIHRLNLLQISDRYSPGSNGNAFSRPAGFEPPADAGSSRWLTMSEPDWGDVGPNTGKGGQDKAPKAESPEEAQEKQTVQEMKGEIAKYGKDPNAQLTDLMRKNQVVGMGDAHGGNEPMEINAEGHLRALVAGGATHLVIETPPSTAAMLDEFNRTGKLDESQLPILSQNENYVNMLKDAHKLGLKVVAGDAEHATSDQPDRDPTMARTIEDILNQPGQDPNHENKVAFWVGSFHLRDFGNPNRPSDLTAAELLKKDGVKLATVGYELGRDGTPVEKAAASLTKPEMLATHDATTLGAYGFYPDSQWDRVILYPGN